MEKTAVVVKRQWGNPLIQVLVNREGINIEMPITDFIKAVGYECGNPTLLFTNNMLIQKMNIATEKVVAEMKASTRQVM